MYLGYIDSSFKNLHISPVHLPFYWKFLKFSTKDSIVLKLDMEPGKLIQATRREFIRRRERKGENFREYLEKTWKIPISIRVLFFFSCDILTVFALSYSKSLQTVLRNWLYNFKIPALDRKWRRRGCREKTNR